LPLDDLAILRPGWRSGAPSPARQWSGEIREIAYVRDAVGIVVGVDRPLGVGTVEYALLTAGKRIVVVRRDRRAVFTVVVGRFIVS
jgi:hypothetical protein